MRWSQGVWSEERIIQAVNETNEFFAIPYGPSGTAPDDDVRAFELYFERLEAAGLGAIKRPDLLVFRKADQPTIKRIVGNLGGLSELPFTAENSEDIQDLLLKVVVAVECENSLWKGRLMPDYGAELKPQKRLGGKVGLKKNAVLPTIILKGDAREEPKLVAKHIIDKNGHILPYVHFEGGAMSLRQEALDILRKLANAED